MINNELTEFYILVLCTKKEEFLLKIGEYLNTGDVKEITRKSYFDNRHAQTVFNILYYIYTKTNKLASKKDIEFIINNIYSNQEQKQDILNVVSDIFQFDEEINWELVDEAALKFVKDRLFIAAVAESQNDIENKNYEAAIERMNKATQVNFDTDYGVNIKDWNDVKNTLYESQDNSVVYPTGYDMLDSEKILNGGCRQREIYVVAASSGVGKTLFMGSLAINFAMSGKKVMYFSFETSASRLAARMLANLFGTTTTSISYNITENTESVKKQWEDNVRQIPGDIRIKEFPSGTMCCNQIESFLLDMKKNIHWEPDVIVLDYIGIMRPNDTRISKENSYVYSGAITVEMRALAYKFNCAVWTGTQLNRNALSGKYNKADIGSDTLSESMTIEHTADFLMFLTHNKEEAQRNRLSAFVVKNRNGEKGVMQLQITESCRLEEIKELK